MKKILSAWMLATLCSLTAQTYKVVATTQHPDGFFQPGEPITYKVQLLCDPTPNPPKKHVYDFKPVAGVNLKYELYMDGVGSKWGNLTSQLTPVTMPSVKLDYPGWTFVKFFPVDKDGKKLTLLKRSENGVGAMVQPEKLTYAGSKPADFDAFWKKQRQALDRIPINPQLTPVNVPWIPKTRFTIYDFKLDCAGGMPVRGHLSIPAQAKPKSLPLHVTFQGAGVYNSGKPTNPKAICINVNAHGILNNQPIEYYQNLDKGKLRGYSHFNKNNRDTFYFLGMYLRVMRTLDFAKTLEQWNGKDLVVSGGSQGGAQSIVAAALDPQVTLCVAGVPALSDHAGTKAVPQRRPGWPHLYWQQKNGKLRPQDVPVAATAEYFDNVNFAQRIKCRVYLSTGFIDTTCVPTSVYVVYNNLVNAAEKHINTFPTGTHGTSPCRPGYQAMHQLFNASK